MRPFSIYHLAVGLWRKGAAALGLEGRRYDDRGRDLAMREYGAAGSPLLVWPVMGSLPSEFLTPTTVWGALIGLVLVGAGIMAAIKLRDVVMREIRTAMQQTENRPAPISLEQPLRIEHVDQVVRVGSFEGRLAPVEARLEKLEGTVNDVLVNPKGYLHESVHQVKNGLQEVVNGAQRREDRIMDKLDELQKENSERTAKVHSRVDKVMEEMPSKIIMLLSQTGQLSQGGKKG